MYTIQPDVPCHFMQSHIRKVYACLAVTCHLHFWQNDRDILRATAVTRGWNRYRNKSQHRKSTLEKKILPPLQQGFEPLSGCTVHGRACKQPIFPSYSICFYCYTDVIIVKVRSHASEKNKTERLNGFKSRGISIAGSFSSDIMAMKGLL